MQFAGPWVQCRMQQPKLACTKAGTNPNQILPCVTCNLHCVWPCWFTYVHINMVILSVNNQLPYALKFCRMKLSQFLRFGRPSVRSYSCEYFEHVLQMLESGHRSRQQCPLLHCHLCTGHIEVQIWTMFH